MVASPQTPEISQGISRVFNDVWLFGETKQGSVKAQPLRGPKPWKRGKSRVRQ